MRIVFIIHVVKNISIINNTIDNSETTVKEKKPKTKNKNKNQK